MHFFQMYKDDENLHVVTFLGESMMAESSIVRGESRNVTIHTLPFLSREVMCLYI